MDRSATFGSSNHGGGGGLTLTKVHALEGDGVGRALFPYLFKMQRELQRSSHGTGPAQGLTAAGASVGGPSPATMTTSGDGDLPAPAAATASSSAAAATAASASSAAMDGGATSAAPLAGAGGRGSSSPSRMASRSNTAASATATATGGGDTLLTMIPVPDTVVFENNFPQAWYVFDARAREMVKLPGKKLDAHELLEGFSHVAENSGGICAQFTASIADDSTSDVRTKTTYFSPATLAAWLAEGGGAEPKEGLLQRFLVPRGEHNDALLVAWSPHLCTAQRRQNIHRLESLRVPMRDRACTFDGPPHLSSETRGNDAVRGHIADLLSRVAKHLLERERRVVSRFVGVFKQDQRGHVWLLHMSSVRIQNDTLLEVNTREPVQVAPIAVQPPSSCPDAYVNEALRLFVTLDGPSCFADRRTYTRVSNSVLDTPAAPLARRDTMDVLGKAVVLSRDLDGALPDEYRALDAFVEDCLYQLYSSRMTLQRGAARPPIEVRLSVPLQTFLGEGSVARLMIDILGFEPTAELPDGSIVFAYVPPPVSTASGSTSAGAGAFLSQQGTVLQEEKPLTVLRKECDALLSHIRRPFTALL